MDVAAFFDATTFTVSYAVSDLATGACAIIDPVRDFDPAAGRVSNVSADRMIDYVRERSLDVQWILETHVHADHVSAAQYLKHRMGGRVAISQEIIAVQGTFGALFNAGPDFVRDGSQFERLLGDGEVLELGALQCTAMHTPGHTPACMTYLLGDAAFVGDTLFMPDYGTARADFPGGDARQLYRSIRRVLELPGQTRLFMCHDYKAPGRDEFAWESTVAEQRKHNVHVHDGVGEDEFVALRESRDATLSVPRLLLPAVQINMRAGTLPPPEENGTAPI